MCKQSCQPTVHVPVLNCQKGGWVRLSFDSHHNDFLYRPGKS